MNATDDTNATDATEGSRSGRHTRRVQHGSDERRTRHVAGGPSRAPSSPAFDAFVERVRPHTPPAVISPIAPASTSLDAAEAKTSEPSIPTPVLPEPVLPKPVLPKPVLPRPRGRERRRARKTPDDVFVPRRQINLASLGVTLRVADALVVTALIIAGVYSDYVGLNNNLVAATLSAGGIGALVFIVSLQTFEAHRFAPTETLGRHLKTVTLAGVAALGVWLTAALIVRPATFVPEALARAGLTALAVLLVLHTLYHQWLARHHARGALAPTVVMLGATPSARRLIEHNARTRELNILAIFDDRVQTAPHNIHGVPVVGRVRDLLEWDALPYVDRIVVTLPNAAEARKRAFVEQVRLLPNRIAYVVDEFETLDHVAQRVREIARVSLREVHGATQNNWYVAAKRAMDVLASGTALLLLSPVLATVAVAVRLSSPGPILFRQKREGFNNRLFDVYKFRSLRVESSDAQAASQVTAGDTRVTKVGAFIRKTSLDELPQLFNILRGDMSLVGPRPHTPGMKTAGEDSRRLVAEYAHRHRVKPGLTGWAQINGSRGPMHDTQDLGRRVTLDCEYIAGANLWWDILIILKTVPCLLGDSEVAR